MKRGWIAVIMIALSLAFGGMDYYYVTSNADIYAGMLTEAQEKMEQSEITEAESVAQRLDYRFRSQKGLMNIFMHHSESGGISCDLAMLEMYARTGGTEEFLATAARAKREIMTMKNSKLLRWENIF